MTIPPEEWVFFAQLIVLVTIWFKYRQRKEPGNMGSKDGKTNGKCPYHEDIVKSIDDHGRKIDDNERTRNLRFTDVDECLKDIQIKVGIVIGQFADLKNTVDGNRALLMEEIGGLKKEVRELILQGLRHARSGNAES